jgi:hypothetical protein
MFQVRHALGVTTGPIMCFSKEEKLNTRLLLKKTGDLGDDWPIMKLFERRKAAYLAFVEKPRIRAQPVPLGKGGTLPTSASPLMGPEPKCRGISD